MACFDITFNNNSLKELRKNADLSISIQIASLNKIAIMK